MAITYFSGNKLLDFYFGATSDTPPASYYFGLSTTSPSINGTGVTEPSGSAYTRISLANNKTNWATASNASLTNSAAVQWAESTGSWGTIVSACMFDALTGGNLYWFDTLTPSRTVSSATTVLLAISSITISMTNS